MNSSVGVRSVLREHDPVGEHVLDAVAEHLRLHVAVEIQVVGRAGMPRGGDPRFEMSVPSQMS